MESEAQGSKKGLSGSEEGLLESEAQGSKKGLSGSEEGLFESEAQGSKDGLLVESADGDLLEWFDCSSNHPN